MESTDLCLMFEEILKLIAISQTEKHVRCFAPKQILGCKSRQKYNTQPYTKKNKAKLCNTSGRKTKPKKNTTTVCKQKPKIFCIP